MGDQPDPKCFLENKYHKYKIDVAIDVNNLFNTYMLNSLEQIVPGRIYRSDTFPNALYMGAVKLDRKTKMMVIVHDGDEDGTLGNEVDFSMWNVARFRFTPVEK